MVNLQTFYQDSVSFLQEADIQSPSLDARLIVMRTLGISDVDFITESTTRLISDEEQVAVQHNLNKRREGMPVSKIFGEKEFWGLSFFVNEHCLDPRPDTETLVEAVIESYKNHRENALRVVDFGTGSGCILISLLKEFPNAMGVAVDISFDALQVAKKNARSLGVSDRIQFVCSDWNSALSVSDENQFDILVSNPPYIESDVIHSLDKEVIHFDPILALDGGCEGLNPYKTLIPQLKNLLKKSGKAFFEIGKGQESDLKRLIEKSGATLSRSYPDIAGIIRVVDISCGDK